MAIAHLPWAKEMSITQDFIPSNETWEWFQPFFQFLLCDVYTQAHYILLFLSQGKLLIYSFTHPFTYLLIYSSQQIEDYLVLGDLTVILAIISMSRLFYDLYTHVHPSPLHPCSYPKGSCSFAWGKGNLRYSQSR